MPERSMSDARRYILRTLSPVHVGSGKTLQPGIEIQEHSGQTFVLDMEAALQRLDASRIRGQRSVGIQDIVPLLRQSGADPSDVALHVLDGSWGGPSLQLREAVRDGGGRSLVPGSSVKGALRTAVLAAKVAEKKAAGRDPVGDAIRALERKSAARKLEARFFRPTRDDPQCDVFRRLAVTDAFFSASALGVSFVSVNSPTPQSPARWKDFTMAVEALPPGAEAELFISLDSFLVGPDAEPALQFRGIGLTWEALLGWTRERSLALIAEERSVFAARGFRHATAQLDRIESTVRTASEGCIPLRLGWGIGWHGTTGGLATEAQRIELLRAFGGDRGNRMAKLGPSAYVDGLVFPKSRRLLKPEEPGSEDATFGWVLLEPAGDRRIPIPEPLRRFAGRPPAPEPTAPPAPAEPPVFSKFRGMLPKDFAGQMGQLVRDAEGLTPEEKAAFAADILKRLDELKMTKDFRKKPWLETLKGWQGA